MDKEQEKAAKARDAALNSALAQIRTDHGEGAIMKMGDENAAVRVKAIPTGALSLDIALGVDPELIERHGAVSGEVAEAMADGALERFGSDFAISITGIELPEIAGISVVGGDPIDIALMRGDIGSSQIPGDGGGPQLLPVPVVAETC